MTLKVNVGQLGQLQISLEGQKLFFSFFLDLVSELHYHKFEPSHT